MPTYSVIKEIFGGWGETVPRSWSDLFFDSSWPPARLAQEIRDLDDDTQEIGKRIFRNGRHLILVFTPTVEEEIEMQCHRVTQHALSFLPEGTGPEHTRLSFYSPKGYAVSPTHEEWDVQTGILAAVAPE